MNKWKTKSGYKIIQILSGRSNVFLLTNGNKNILIDTSVSRSWTRLQKQLDLVLTHAHIDHAANANRIKEKFNSKVVLHSKEENYLKNGDNILPKGTNIFTRSIVNIIGKNMFSAFKYELCEPDILVDSEYDLSKIGFNAYLMHTPGHTIGSISLVVDNEIALVGDTMFGIFRRSVFPPYAEDKNLMIKSWGKLLETECSEFLPSHGTANGRFIVQKDYNKRTKKLRRTTLSNKARGE